MTRTWRWPPLITDKGCHSTHRTTHLTRKAIRRGVFALWPISRRPFSFFHGWNDNKHLFTWVKPADKGTYNSAQVNRLCRRARHSPSCGSSSCLASGPDPSRRYGRRRPTTRTRCSARRHRKRRRLDPHAVALTRIRSRRNPAPEREVDMSARLTAGEADLCLPQADPGAVAGHDPGHSATLPPLDDRQAQDPAVEALCS